jgi:hypothetical protein
MVLAFRLFSMSFTVMTTFVLHFVVCTGFTAAFATAIAATATVFGNENDQQQ